MRILLVLLLAYVASQGLYAQEKDTISAYGKHFTGGEKIDTSKIEYFPSPPEILFTPKAIVPDSLLPVMREVKVMVRAIVDSSRKPSFPYVLRSDDPSFNALAESLATEYRIDANKAMKFYKVKSVWVVIPIVFKKTKTK